MARKAKTKASAKNPTTVATKVVTKAKTSKRGKRSRRLNITAVRAISEVISKPCQDSVHVTTIWNSTKTSQHLIICPRERDIVSYYYMINFNNLWNA